MFNASTTPPRHAFSPSRRNTLKKTAVSLCAGMLPLSLAGSVAGAATPAARYRRYNVSSGSRTSKRMLDSYARAVRAMLALPPEDPRNWYRHAVIHTLDCPHGNWWFLVWHRGYLGWFERICRELSNDPEFALPYWDWTSEQKVPAGLFEGVLDPNHNAYIPAAEDFERRFKGALAASSYWTSPGGTFDPRSQYGQLLARNVRFDADLMFDIVTDPSGRLFYDQPGARGLRRERPDFSAATVEAVAPDTIRAALAAPDFITFASPKSFNHATMAGFSVLEAKPHNAVHRCVGSHECNFIEPEGFMTDMLSSVDPLFYLHHANLDRLWDVWTRKQARLGLPTLPDGVELRTDLPDEQKSAEETATDYYRWAREPMLFFVDAQGRPVAQTRAGDYASTASFSYDYEAGSGEEAVTGQPRPQAGARRVYTGSVTSRRTDAGGVAGATVKLPAEALEQARTAGATVIANITLNFPEFAHHQPYVVILNGPDDPSGVDAGSPYYLATISMFGHKGHGGPVSYALPLGNKLAGAGMAQALAANGTLRVRVVPLHGMMGHHDMAAEPVELLGVTIETY